MNKWVTLLGLIVVAVMFSNALAGERIKIVTDANLSGLAKIALKHANLDSIQIGTSNEPYTYCQISGSDEIVLTTQKMSRDNFDVCIKQGVHGVVEYEIGYTGFVFIGSNKVPDKMTSGEIATLLTGRSQSSFVNFQTIERRRMAQQKFSNQGMFVSIPSSGTIWQKSLLGMLRIPKCSVNDWRCYQEVISQNKRLTYWSNLENLGDKLQKSAITAIPYSYYKKLNIHRRRGLKLLSIDGVKPNYENLKNTSYTPSHPVYAYRRITDFNVSPEAKRWLTALGDLALNQTNKLEQLGIVTDRSSANKCPKPRCPKSGSCTSIIRMSVKCCPKTGSCK